MQASELALFWGGVICLAVGMYTILDGFDLGIAVLFGATREEALRVRMMDSIAPFWDGNETWLVVTGAGLYAAFPDVYAVFCSAFYLPILLLLLGLIFRGIAFEFRFRSERMRPLWDYGFIYGSVIAAFVQGAAVGAWVYGIPVVGGRYAGGSFGWLHPFSILTGIGLVLGYALLGAGWLTLKDQGQLREWAYRRIRPLAWGVLIVLSVAFLYTLKYNHAASHVLQARPWGYLFPLVALAALIEIVAGARGRRDQLPFALTVVFFIASFLTLATMFWPYTIPYTLTIAASAAPDVSLRFFLYAGAFVLPVILAYTVAVYWVFRGKIRKESEPPPSPGLSPPQTIRSKGI